MARAIWTGSVSFGLVNVPVALYSATEDKTIHFNQFEAGTSDRIRYKRVNERTGREVKLPDIVRGREVAKGDYVLITDEELEAVEPGRSRTIDITDFPAIVYADIAAVGPAKSLEPLPKRREVLLHYRIVLPRRHPHDDPPHALVLLRACRERPHGRCAPEHGEKLAPSHSQAP